MGLALIVIGIVVALVWSPLIGLIIFLIGVVFVFVPAAPYGYSSWRGRRGPPP